MKLNNMETGNCHFALLCSISPLVILLCYYHCYYYCCCSYCHCCCYCHCCYKKLLLLLLPSHLFSVTVRATSSSAYLHTFMFSILLLHILFIPQPSILDHSLLNLLHPLFTHILSQPPPPQPWPPFLAALRLAIARNDTSIRNALEAFRDDSSESNLSATLRRISRQTIDDTMEEKEANRNREEVRISRNEEMVWYDVMWCDMISCDMILCNVIWCNVMWQDMMWYEVKWCDMMERNGS